MNPYEVLEIAPNATDEEVKLAYKNMVKKYHPDKYVNNPLADLAEEKLKNINEAYEKIKKERASGQTQYESKKKSYDNKQNYQSRESAKYLQIRSYINSRRYSEAYALLSAIRDRDSEWYYLSAVVTLHMGWYDMASQYIDTAISLNPNITEYHTFKTQMVNMNSMYRAQSYNQGYSSSPGLCNTCTCLCCADSLCECLGGDLISCC
ncbi:MAG: DnaJ domain-containing protein [Andreesenia angusta]|nr:DnaJ domain-containing protein [Andreesenia angusta]